MNVIDKNKFSPRTRGEDGLQIVGEAPMELDGIASREDGVESEMLLAGEALFLKREVIAPGAVSKRHYHATASIIAILEGQVRVNYGNHFQHTEYVKAGEFVFIPALMPHQPVNESDESLICLVVRNAPWDEILPFDEGVNSTRNS